MVVVLQSFEQSDMGSHMGGTHRRFTLPLFCCTIDESSFTKNMLDWDLGHSVVGLGVVVFLFFCFLLLKKYLYHRYAFTNIYSTHLQEVVLSE